mgnify:CR=1 FL=1
MRFRSPTELGLGPWKRRACSGFPPQGTPYVNKNDSAQPSRQMRCYQCRSRLPLRPASARLLRSSRPHPRPTPGRSSCREPTSVSHPRNRSPGPNPCASGRTRSWPTSTRPEPAMVPPPLNSEERVKTMLSPLSSMSSGGKCSPRSASAWLRNSSHMTGSLR